MNYEFWGEHYILAFFAIVLLACLAGTFIECAMKILNRILRSINIAIRGWPPQHLDADGDWMSVPVKESDDASSEGK